MKKSYISFFIALTFSTFVFAQNDLNPGVMPISPEAAMFSKMVNYPVAMYTGIPDISVPLHEITTQGVTIPIGLKYHSGGFKTSERAGAAGLGWILECELQITLASGRSDVPNSGSYSSNPKMKEYNFGNPYLNNYFPNRSEKSLLSLKGVETAPPKYNYKLLNKSGSFYLQNSASGNKSQNIYVPSPYDDIKIQYRERSNGHYYFIITDSDGTKYTFDKIEINDVYWDGSGGYDSAWKCSSIHDFNGRLIAEFTYQDTRKKIKVPSYLDTIEYWENYNMTGAANAGIPNNISESAFDGQAQYANYKYNYTPRYKVNIAGGKSYYYLVYLDQNNNIAYKEVSQVTPENSVLGPETIIETKTLESIVFREGKINFTYDTNGFMKKIVVNEDIYKNNRNKEIKTIEFIQTVVQSAAATNILQPSFKGTNYLDEIIIKNENQEAERYGFKYYSEQGNVRPCFGPHLKGHDAWGYMSEKTTKPNLGSTIEPFPNGIFPNIVKQLRGKSYVLGQGGPIACDIMTGSSHVENPEASDFTKIRAGVLSDIIYPTGGRVHFNYEANYYDRGIWDIYGRRTKFNINIAGGLRIKSISYYDSDNTGIEPDFQKYYVYGEYENGLGYLTCMPYQNLLPSLDNNDDGSFKPHSSTVEYNYYSAFSTIISSGHEVPVWGNRRGTETRTTYMLSYAADMTNSTGSPIYYTMVTEYNKDHGKLSGKTVYRFQDMNRANWTYLNVLEYPFYAVMEGTNLRRPLANWHLGSLLSETKYKHDGTGFKEIYKKEYTYDGFRLNTGPRVVPGAVECVNVFVGSYIPPNTTFTEDYVVYYDSHEYGISIGKIRVTGETETWTNENGVYNKATTYSYKSVSRPRTISTTDSNGVVRQQNLYYPDDFSNDQIYDTMKKRGNISTVVNKIEYTDFTEISQYKTTYKYIPGTKMIVPAEVLASTCGENLQTEISYDLYDPHGNLLQYTDRGGVPKSYLWGYNHVYPVAEVIGKPYNEVSGKVSQSILNSPASDTYLRQELKNLYDLGNSLVSSYTYKPMVGITSTKSPDGKVTSYVYDRHNRLSSVTDDKGNIIHSYEYNYGNRNQALHSIDAVPEMGTYYTKDDSNNRIGLYDFFFEPGRNIGFQHSTTYGSEAVDVSLADPEDIVWYPASEMARVEIKYENSARIIHGLPYYISFKLKINFWQGNNLIAAKWVDCADPWVAAGQPAPEVVDDIYLPAGSYKITVVPYVNNLLKNYVDYYYEARDPNSGITSGLIFLDKPESYESINLSPDLDHTIFVN